MRHLVLLLVMALAMGGPCTEADLIPPVAPTWQVDVVNGLSNGMLFAHCKSKDDDLGQRNLTVGSEFNWTFRINFFATTLFWCYLRKPGADMSFEVFWVEKGSRDWLSHRCNESDKAYCIWTAKDDGIYLKNIPDNVNELVHKWNPLTH